MALPITITDAGRAEIINAQNTGTGPVTITEIGFGTGQYTPTKTRSALQAQVKRVSSIAGQAVAADTIHVMALDESSDAYNVGEFGLFSDKGTLVAVYSQPTASGWIIQKAGASTLLLANDIILESLNATSITFGDISFLNPPATETVPGVVMLENTLTSTSTSRALTAAQGKELQDGKQPRDDTLTALAALITAANKLIYATGVDTFATADLTAFARSLLDDADAAAARATLGAQAQDATLTALAGLATAANKLIYATGVDTFATADLSVFARSLLDDANAGEARATLGAAPLNSPALTGNPTAPTPAATVTDTSIANMAAVRAAMALFGISDKNSAKNVSVDQLDSGLHILNRRSSGGNTPSVVDAGDYCVVYKANYQASAGVLSSALVYATSSRRLWLMSSLGTSLEDVTQELWTSANLSISAFAKTFLDDVDAATARSTLGLVKQASPTDVTPGSVLAMGAFGLGDAILLAGGSNLNALTQPGTYLYGSGADLFNAPLTGASYIEVVGKAAYPVQIFHRIYQNRRFFRASRVANPTTATADWNEWVELLHTGSVSSFAMSLLDDADAVGARATLGITVADGGLGYGQTWQDVTASRAWNTTYTNTTGKPIQVSVVARDQGAYYTSVYVSGVLIGRWDMSTSLEYCQTFIVPPGATYMVSGNNGSAGGNILSCWLELR